MDLGAPRNGTYPDPDHRVDEWAKGILERDTEARHAGMVLTQMASTISQGLQRPRPVRSGGGKHRCQKAEVCSGKLPRDFALFMMEAGAADWGARRPGSSGYMLRELAGQLMAHWVGGGRPQHAFGCQVFPAWGPGLGSSSTRAQRARPGGHNLKPGAVAAIRPRPLPAGG